MCGRYTLTADTDALIKRFNIKDYQGEHKPRYNIAPTQKNPVVLLNEKTERIMTDMRWGFDTTEGKRQDFASNDIISALIEEAKNFVTGPKDKNRPFWIASFNLTKLLKLPKYGFVWSNLIKIDDMSDVGNKTARVKQDIEQKLCGLGLLQEEIKITRPNVVVFFTGPHYDNRLDEDFKGIDKKNVEPYKERQFARLKHELLPNSFRIYHPDYLNWAGKWNMIELLADEVKKIPI